jgi:hypothetical protein
VRPERLGTLARAFGWTVSVTLLAGTLSACGSAGTSTSTQRRVSSAQSTPSGGTTPRSTQPVAVGSSCVATFGPASAVSAEFHASGPLVLHGSGGGGVGLECYYSLASGSSFPVLGLLVGKYVTKNAPAFGRAPDGTGASALAIQPANVTVTPANDAWLSRAAARYSVHG